jgi:hypothetical protein
MNRVILTALVSDVTINEISPTVCRYDLVYGVL